MADDDRMKPEEANLAIARAAAQQPRVQQVREKLQKLAADEERGLQVLAAAIKRMLREG